ncbi:uncharacterized protein LOC126576648 [Anopheles aquasalis]|uniref:uncharacterized protein LOC126576648 n=1 Tax=Anopheles aquasalis TaxID=42839 RepID=UPI00215A3DF3|nr:uncharacterized protein LOC126576648 [Anopheles aquasalis]
MTYGLVVLTRECLGSRLDASFDKNNILPLLLVVMMAMMFHEVHCITVHNSYSIKHNVPHGASEHVTSSHTFDTKNPDHWGNKQYKEVTITKNVPVPVPIKYERHVAIPVRIPVPIAIHNKIPILVERKVPVYVEKPFPVQVDRPVPYALPIEVPVFHKVAVEVPKPYPVHIPKPYPVFIKKPVYMKQRPQPDAGQRVKKSPGKLSMVQRMRI